MWNKLSVYRHRSVRLNFRIYDRKPSYWPFTYMHVSQCPHIGTWYIFYAVCQYSQFRLQVGLTQYECDFGRVPITLVPLASANMSMTSSIYIYIYIYIHVQRHIGLTFSKTKDERRKTLKRRQSFIRKSPYIGCHPPTRIIWVPPPRCASGRTAPVRADLAASAKGVLIGPWQPQVTVLVTYWGVISCVQRNIITVASTKKSISVQFTYVYV